MENMDKPAGDLSRSTMHPKTVHWLQRLKDESWEAELLVSAIAVFGTYQLFDLKEFYWG